MKDILLGFLSRTLNRPVDEVARLVYKVADDQITDEPNEDALQVLLNLDAERVSGLKGPDRFDEGHKAGKSEALLQLEKKLRAQHSIQDPELKGLDLINAIVAKAAKAEGDVDKIKTSEHYLALERQMREQLEATENDWKTKYADLEIRQAKQERWMSTAAQVEQHFAELGIVLPTNPTAAARQKADFLTLIKEGYDFQVVDGQTVILDRDGKRVENAQRHPLGVKELVAQLAAERFDFAAQQPAGNAGNGDEGAGGNAGNGFQKPKNRQEALDRFYSSNDANERSALQAFMDAAEQ